MNYFKNKIALVTGGGAGIGRALCKELAKRGCFVIVTDINSSQADHVAKSIIENGGQAKSLALDISNYRNVQKVFQAIIDEFGRLDILFNNAAVTVIGEAQDITVGHWERIVDINIKGTFYCTTESYALMVKQGFGQIVNLSSVVGLIGFPTNSFYSATKAGIITLSNSLRVEGFDKGVKVNVACPGYVKTDIYNTSPVINADKNKVWEKPMFKMISAHKASQIILHGIERNKPIIVFPFYAKLLWWLCRINPFIFFSLGKNIVKDFQALRS